MSQRLALKEWHPIIRAICHDRTQTVLFRKGGILDSKFEATLHGNLAYFFPTSYHIKPGMLKAACVVENVDIKALEVIPVEYAFQITGAWHCTDPRIGEILDDFHMYGPSFLETRLQFKKQEPLCVLEVEPFRLSEPVLLENRDDLWGCFSWVDLKHHIYSEENLLHVSHEPILEDFAYRQEKLRQCLADSQVSGISPLAL